MSFPFSGAPNTAEMMNFDTNGDGPKKPYSSFKVGMNLRLDGRPATVTDVFPDTGMSMVCRVTTEVQGVTRNAVLKVMLPSLRSDEFAPLRFSEECCTLNFLTAKIIDAGQPRCVPEVYNVVMECAIVIREEDGVRMAIGKGLLMEDIEGTDPNKILNNWLKDHHDMRDRADYCGFKSPILPLALAAVGALDRVHNTGIVHRDIKESAFIQRPDGTMCLIDFGISARFGHTTEKQVGTFLGTIAYTPPEKILDKGLDAPASFQEDLYALGAMLYNLHCEGGFRNFGSPLRYIDYLLKTRQEGLKIPERRKNSPMVPIISKLMADIGERYKTAEEVLQDLQKIVCVVTPRPGGGRIVKPGKKSYSGARVRSIHKPTL